MTHSLTHNVVGRLSALALLAISGAAGAATTVVVTPNGFTAPKNGFVAYGSALNAAGTAPIRHLWADDHLQGVCRLDPDLDTATATGAALTINPNTCLGGGTPVTGPAAYDPDTNYVYVVDEIAKNNRGVVRAQYSASADGGHGGISNALISLGGTGTCGIGGGRGASAALGPDGNLYVGVLKSGSLYRVKTPNAANVPCSDVQVIGATPDGKRGLGLAWVGHDLYGLDGTGPFAVRNADKCLTASTNGAQCASETVFGGAAILAAGIGSDQNIRPRAAAGSAIYLGDVNGVIKITQPASTSPVFESAWSAGEANASGFAVDPKSAPNTVFVFDDRTAGGQTLQGRLFKVSENVVAAAPSIPTGVSATAGDAAATVSWTAPQDNGAPISSYTVHTLANNGTTVADSTVTANGGAAVPSTTVIAGLGNGVGYQFSVEAMNAVGSSPASALSNLVTPKAAVVPSAPQNVTALPSDSSVQLAWGTPTSDGGRPITHYLVITTSNGSDVQQTVNAPANGVLISPLQNGSSYLFRVVAVNAIGQGEPSLQTGPVTPTVGNADVNVGLSGPASVSSGSAVSYLATVTNVGTRSLPGVRLLGTLPANGGSASTTSGSCTVAGTSLDCNLGPFALNTAVSVTLSLPTLSATGMAQVSASSQDLQGQLLTDVNPADNSASVTTTIVNPPQTSTTDLSVGGKVSFVSLLNTNASYTFTVSNGGAAVANLVTFQAALPVGLRFNSYTAPAGWSCSSTVSGNGTLVNCTTNTLGVRATANILISATPTVAGTHVTTASVGFSGTDTKPANNSVSVSIKAK